MHTKEFFIGLGVLIIVVIGAFFLYERESPQQPSSVATTTPEQVVTVPSVEAQADAVLQALSEHNGAALATFVHPTEGVRFSPYGHIDLKNDVVLHAADIATIYTKDTKRTWGSYDGSGKPITLTFAEYSKKFIYDEDFLNAPEKATNQIIGKGNTAVNITEAYPGSTFVEYHFNGFDPQYEGMDWRSLRLIFTQIGNAWYLVGISHDEWTI